MWREEHRARHDARLKEIVSLHAVGQIARWLERADPPRSGRATPYAAVVRAIAWHLRIGGPWRALTPGGPPWQDLARGVSPRGESLRMVSKMAGAGTVRTIAGGSRPPTPPGRGPPGQASPEHHRYASGQVHSGARSPWIRRRQEGARAQARGPG